MKKLISIFLISVLFISCEKENTEIKTKSETYPFEEILLSPQINKALVVLNSLSDTIAIVTSPSYVSIPMDTPITIEEIDNSNNNLDNLYQIYQVVAFEDSRNGDFDYNDLVVRLRIIQRNNNTQISVQPIALGSTKPIKFGVRINGINYILSENCREDLFDGDEGFINTLPNKTRKVYDKFKVTNFPITRNTYGKSIDWFIEVDKGLRLYAVSKNYPTLNRPYGLIFVDLNEPFYHEDKEIGLEWFDYPAEFNRIESVYPDFFKNLTFKEIYSNKSSGYFEAIKIDESRRVLDDCLYLLKNEK